VQNCWYSLTLICLGTNSKILQFEGDLDLNFDPDAGTFFTRWHLFHDLNCVSTFLFCLYKLNRFVRLFCWFCYVMQKSCKNHFYSDSRNGRQISQNIQGIQLDCLVVSLFVAHIFLTLCLRPKGCSHNVCGMARSLMFCRTALSLHPMHQSVSVHKYWPARVKYLFCLFSCRQSRINT